MMRWLPSILHRGVIQPLTRMLPASDRYLGFDVKAKAFARGFPAPDALRNFYWTCAFSDRELPQLVRAERLDASDVAAKLDLARERWTRASGPMGKLAYQYQQQYLPDYVLANSDRASMLHSVELRTPYLSPDLAAYANALPDSLKMRGGVTKSLLRNVARNRLPEAILKRRKIGFTTPAAALVKGPLADDVRDCLSPARLARVGLFDGAYVGRILAEHFANRHNHYKQIWALYMLQKWLLARELTLR
jgi:asparagine synthase (glutamine-hydrolysing)